MLTIHPLLRLLALLTVFVVSTASIPKPQASAPEPEPSVAPAEPTKPNVVAQGREGSLSEPEPEPEPAVIESLEIKLSGSKLHFLASGDPGAPTVLLLHGARFSAQTWRDLGTLELLSRQGYRALALDLPGYGQSEASEIPRERVLGSLLPLISDRSVVVVSPSMSGSFSFPLLTRRSSLVAGFVPVAPAAIAPHLEAVRNTKVPTLIFWGENDQVIPLKQGEQLNRTLPNSRLVVLEGAKHPCYLDRPLDFHRELLQFLRSLRF
ncbi:MAG: alpha/beta hydrolase [Acidobacteriota bacterium]